MTSTAETRTGAARWLPMVVLAAAQIVMVLDSTVMNVQIGRAHV